MSRLYIISLQYFYAINVFIPFSLKYQKIYGIPNLFNVGNYKEQISVNHQSKLLEWLCAILHTFKSHVSLCGYLVPSHD